MKLHHIGLVTKNVAKCVKLYEALGYTKAKLVHDPAQMASIALMQRAREPMIEQIAPENEQSPAYKWLERIKAGPYHTCYESPSLSQDIEFMRELGFGLIMDPIPAVAFDNRRVTFLWSSLAGLVELLESVSNDN